MTENSNSPTTLASWSPVYFANSASDLSSTEAGPACFLRKLTIPSTESKEESRRATERESETEKEEEA